MELVISGEYTFCFYTKLLCCMSLPVLTEECSPQGNDTVLKTQCRSLTTVALHASTPHSLLDIGKRVRVFLDSIIKIAGQSYIEINYRQSDMGQDLQPISYVNTLRSRAAKWVHVKEVADRFNLFTHAASLQHERARLDPGGWCRWSQSEGNEPRE